MDDYQSMSSSPGSPGKLTIAGQPRYLGFIEKCDGPRIWGWAVDRDSAKPFRLDFMVGSCRLAKIPLRNFRPDTLFHYGRGISGFDVHFDDWDPKREGNYSFFEGQPFQILFPDGTEVPVLSGVSRFIGGIEKTDDDKSAILTRWLEDGLRFSLKHGRVIEPFSKDTAKTRARTASLARFMTAFEQAVGEPLCLAYGTLLGAVRSGDVIPHDDDFDTFIFCRSDSMAQLIQWKLRILEKIRKSGLECGVFSSGLNFSVAVKFEGEYFDVFVAWIRPERRITSFHVDMRFSEDDFFPLAPVHLGEQQLLGPAKPAAFLKHCYGEGWCKPDADFMWEPPIRSLEIEAIWRTKFLEALNLLAPDFIIKT